MKRYIRTSLISPSYRPGDIVYKGNAKGYQCTQSVSGDINNFPSELDDYVKEITYIGEDKYKIYLLMKDEDGVSEQNYKNFERFLYPILENAGFTLLD